MQMDCSTQEHGLLPLRGDWRLRSGKEGASSASNTDEAASIATAKLCFPWC